MFSQERSLNESLHNIKLLVEYLYALFESNYGQSEELERRINFEVTFMTKSFIDGNITIPAYANRDKRAPISMAKRQNIPDNRLYHSV